jgi:hypothetical protein
MISQFGTKREKRHVMNPEPIEVGQVDSGECSMYACNGTGEEGACNFEQGSRAGLF